MTTGRIEVGPTGRAVAANVKRLRKARGLSLRALSAELKARGRTLSADALNKIENGAEPDGRGVRRVDVDDLAALAVVFGVSPAALLVPFTPQLNDSVSVTGAGAVPAIAAWEWATGRHPLRYDPDRRRETQDMEYVLLGAPVWTHRGHEPTDLGLKVGEALLLAWDEDGRPYMRLDKQADDPGPGD
ncbi:helix-turn-helix domain-containing protein [Streptomyces cellulosae]|uniref:helix-turn-helix domain-containing protein n=1 Tax=Streptomyces cellulosae TaxID=1968 RepID=UPI0036899F38